MSIETATAAHIAAQPGGKRWVAIVADAGFGRGALATMTPVITAQGGEVVKSFIVPPNTRDLSAVLMEARALDPDVIDMRCRLIVGASQTRGVDGPGGRVRVFTPRRYPAR